MQKGKKTFLFLLSFFIAFLFIISPLNNVVSAYSNVDTLEFETYDCNNPDVCYATGNIYAISYTGTGNDGWVKTVSIDTYGNIADTVISEYEFQNDYARYINIIKVYDNIFALAYIDGSSNLYVSTIYISESGGIVQNNISTHFVNSSISQIFDFHKVGNNTFFILSRNGSIYTQKMRFITLTISNDGTVITTVTNNYDKFNLNNNYVTYDANMVTSFLFNDFPLSYYSIYVVVDYYLWLGSTTGNFSYRTYRLNYSGTYDLIDSYNYAYGIVVTNLKGYILREMTLSKFILMSFALSGDYASYLKTQTLEITNAGDIDNDGIINTLSYGCSGCYVSYISYDGMRTDATKVTLFYEYTTVYPSSSFYLIFRTYTCDDVGIHSFVEEYEINHNTYRGGLARMFRVSTNGRYAICFNEYTSNDGFIITVSGFPTYGTVGDEGGEQPEEPCSDMLYSTLNYFGANSIPYNTDTDNDIYRLTSNLIKTLYKIPIRNATARGLDLFLGVAQYNSVPSLGSYVLEINGNAYLPCSFTSYSPYIYRLRYSFDPPIYLTSQTLMEFSTSNGWWLLLGKNLDIDNDGTIEFKYSSVGNPSSLNGIYDGEVYRSAYIGWCYPYCYDYFDLYYRVYYENLQIQNNVSGFNYDLITTDKTLYTIGDTPVFINYWLKQLPSDIYIFKDNVSIGSEQNYPISVSKDHDYLNYVPIESGSYSAVIVRNGINESYANFTVLDNINSYILTYPNPSKHNEQYTIKCVYKNDIGTYGLMRDGYYLPLNANSNTRTIPVNTTTYYTTSTSATLGNLIVSKYYYVLYKDIGSNTFIENYTHTHLLSPIVTTSNINIDNNKIELLSKDDKFTLRIYGVVGNPFVNAEIRINNKSIISLPFYTTQFNQYYDITNIYEGYNQIGLYNKNNNDLLDYKNFTVSVKTENPNIPSNPIDIIPVIFKLPLGIGLAILFICIPLFVSYKAHIDLNMFIYLFFGVLGLIISSAIGLIDPIIIGVIIFVLTLIIVVMWLERKMV